MDTLNESVGDNMQSTNKSMPKPEPVAENKEETKPFEDSDIPF